MGRYEWIDKLKAEEYLMPFVVKQDIDYSRALKDKLSFICDDVKNAGASELCVKTVIDVCDRLLDALDKYYKGDIWEAHVIIDDLIHSIDMCEPAVSNINNTYALWGKGEKVNLFRARLSDSMLDFPAEEMLHIPFDLRTKVKSERFSIPGLPCLYLGNTSYSCWIELGSPADYRFNVSPIYIEGDVKVLNLAVSIRHIRNWNDSLNDSITREESDKILNEWLKLLLLTVATSYSVNENGRDFKSEYILPQMIMLACKSHALAGVVYISKKVSEEIFGMVAAVNVALFAAYSGEKKYSKICDSIQISDSCNFAMYNRILMNSMKYKDTELTIQNAPIIRNIGSYDRQIPYYETTFFGFDKYLFTSTKMRCVNSK